MRDIIPSYPESVSHGPVVYFRITSLRNTVGAILVLICAYSVVCAESQTASPMLSLEQVPLATNTPSGLTLQSAPVASPSPILSPPRLSMVSPILTSDPNVVPSTFTVEGENFKRMQEVSFLEAKVASRLWAAFGTSAVAFACSAILKLVFDYLRRSKADEKLKEAEKQAFVSIPESTAKRIRDLSDSQINLEQRTEEIGRRLTDSYAAVQMGGLFNLYSKQIEKYQTQTQSRAGWSFFCAIAAMISGLAMVVWGGTHIVFYAGWEHVTAGSLISSIGGAVSAYITKTFLDVHKLSLIQLNHYFSQPVINTHILTAQRLADQLVDEQAKQRVYEAIIEKVSNLIVSQPIQLTDVCGNPVSNQRASSSPAKSE